MLKAAEENDRVNSEIAATVTQFILNLTIEQYVSELRDLKLQLKMMKYSIKTTQSLHEVYVKAETEKRQLKTEQKMMN